MSKTKGLVKEEIINDIVSMIINGTLNKGDLLPSIRCMSNQYKVSRGTILVVYKQLELMGYIQGFERSGYIVIKNSIPPQSFTLPQADSHLKELSVSPEEETERQLQRLEQRRTCKLPPHFIKRWANDYDNFSRSISSFDASHLQRFLKLSRGMTVESDSLLLFSGFQEALTLIALYLQQRKQTIVIIEEPCQPHIRTLFKQFNFDIILVPVDQEGICVTHLPLVTDATLLCMPTLQYPMATRLSAERKAQLYQWAADNRIMIIEDDSYAMLGFGHSLSPPLFLQPNNVTIIYLTQLIEIVGSSYNVALLVLPPSLIADFNELNIVLSSTYPPVNFYLVETFLASSYLMKYLTALLEERHIKSRLAREICLNQLSTLELNHDDEYGFSCFLARVSEIPIQLINTVLFPITTQTQDDHQYFLFPHGLLTQSELERVNASLLQPG
ncbi:GntR family transcriptional regulator [Tatumella ptyseos]|uniref:GntR family transcriptional regulator n=1 Tax=Tatumella ptyseos TaxID=82987 RepID=UPI0026E95A8F|nr:PLP-dependent aminotransferase family protein [Tatumella ptyseos]WKX27259.1 PLP-dependent aminotransferase family protein [Tatumella ptyseos]